MFEMGSSPDETPALHTEATTGRLYYRERVYVSSHSGGWYEWEKVYVDQELGLVAA